MQTATVWERREALIIVNPAAHNTPKRTRLQEADDWLRAQGWRAEWQETTGAGDATSIAARSAAAGVPLVIAVGGDGTLRESAAGLLGTGTTLAQVPAGTSNLWAREVGIKRRPVRAVEQAITGQRRRIDVGMAGDQVFVLMAGYGIDAAVTQNVSLDVKGRVGAAAYAFASVREAIRYRGTQMTLRLDGEEVAGHVLMLIAGNTRLYAGITQITPEAVVDDGFLDVRAYMGRGRVDLVRFALQTLFRRHRGSGRVVYRRVRELYMDWEHPLPVQLDGDPYPGSPNHVKVVPDSLWMAVPAGLKSPIFGGPIHP
ncbi:MAG TPA: diacylglycerol kinase family protein [Dehalococcoidia bacterium]|nr:diacylglycerol kinase family protein [Dehalococcoidia bacterium]